MDREQLFNDNIHLVDYIVNKHFNFYTLNYRDELTQEGRFLLWKAVLQYEDRGAKLSTYAYQIIYRGLQSYLHKNMGLINIVREQKKRKRTFRIEFMNNKSLDYDFNTDDDVNNSKMHDLFGFNDSGYSNVDYNLYIEYLNRYFRRMAKYDRHYQDCDKILDLLLKGINKKQDICRMTHHEYGYITRRLELIKNTIIDFLEGGNNLEEEFIRKKGKKYHIQAR